MKSTLVVTTALLLILSPNFSASAHDPKEMGEMSKLAQKTTMLPATNLIPGKPQLYTIQVHSASGKPINKFQIQHEKLMHLILVSSDLKSFQHLHPTYLGKGKFQISASFPTDGQYTAFMDYVPKGSTQRVDVATLKVGNIVPETTIPAPDSTLVKAFGDLNVALLIDPKTIRPGQETPITFEIKNADGKPVEDLQPYLGAMGHLVIIKASPVLTAASYLHAHPEGHDQHSGMDMSGMDMSKMPAMSSKDKKMPSMSGMDGMSSTEMKLIPGQVTFETHFPSAGTYRLWGQFQRAGKVLTADFTITI
jgi:hypothetical protein